MKFFKIASQPFRSLGFRPILTDPKILLFSVVADVSLQILILTDNCLDSKTQTG